MKKKIILTIFLLALFFPFLINYYLTYFNLGSYWRFASYRDEWTFRGLWLGGSTVLYLPLFYILGLLGFNMDPDYGRGWLAGVVIYTAALFYLLWILGKKIGKIK